MLKIFLTGDNHIGLKYAGHNQSAILCEKRMEAFENMIHCANAEHCNLFVIAGDLFENTYSIAKKDIQRILNMLSEFHETVVVLPGNHDYYDEDTRLWEYFNELKPSFDNILLLSEYKPYSLTCGDEKVILYPAHCTTLHSSSGENNLGWMKETPINDDSAYHIGIAHGAVEGETIDREGSYFLMQRDELESLPMDVWLIGHTHVPFPKNLPEGNYTDTESIFNAGTHVQTDVSCSTDGQCFFIEISSDKCVKAKKFTSGNLHFYRRNISVSAYNFEEELHRALSDISDDSVVDIIPVGAISSEEYDRRHNILESVLNRFIEGTYHDTSLSCLITKERIDSEFAETSFSAQFLTALLDNPKEAQLAYELLNSIKEDTTK